MASSTRDINDLVEWVRTYTRGIVQGTQPSADAEVWVKNCYELYCQMSSPLNRDSGEKIAEVTEPPRAQFEVRPPSGRASFCFTCQSPHHRAISCPYGFGPSRNPQMVRQDRAFYPPNVQPPQRLLNSYGNQNFNPAPRFDNPNRGFAARPPSYSTNYGQGRGQNYSLPAYRNPNWSDNRPPPRSSNEGPYRGNTSSGLANPNPPQNMYNRGGSQGMRPPFNHSGVRVVTPYVEFPPEYVGAEGNFNYQEGMSPGYETDEGIAPFYPPEDRFYQGEMEAPVEPDLSVATGVQQLQEYMSLNQTKLTEQIANQGAVAQQLIDEQTQRMNKMEESLKAQGAKISAMRNLPSYSDESTDPQEPTSLN
ncbi:MAG: hypothetical protein GY820_13485, partial [Gammaproteobacteria bacterium]|nr:hypothetical protein [Gammaproteobacteria bacterium]